MGSVFAGSHPAGGVVAFCAYSRISPCCEGEPPWPLLEGTSQAFAQFPAHRTQPGLRLNPIKVPTQVGKLDEKCLPRCQSTPNLGQGNGQRKSGRPRRKEGW